MKNNKWKIAKAIFESSSFPSVIIKTKVAKIKDAEEDLRLNGVSTYSKSHKENKKSHKGVRSVFYDLTKFEGYKATFTQDYCFECRRVVGQIGTLLNNETGTAYQKTFMLSSYSVPERFDGGLGFV